MLLVGLTDFPLRFYFFVLLISLPMQSLMASLRKHFFFPKSCSKEAFFPFKRTPPVIALYCTFRNILTNKYKEISSWSYLLNRGGHFSSIFMLYSLIANCSFQIVRDKNGQCSSILVPQNLKEYNITL